jgi:hypothetical protein
MRLRRDFNFEDEQALFAFVVVADGELGPAKSGVSVLFGTRGAGALSGRGAAPENEVRGGS